METIVSLLNALAAIPQILGFLEKFAQGVSLWYMQRQTADSLQGIADAAAYSARASNPVQRQIALDKWRAALSRPRVLP